VWYASESDSNSLPAEALSKRENVQEVEPKNNQTIAENETPKAKENLVVEIRPEDVAQSSSGAFSSEKPGLISMNKQDAASSEKMASNNDNPLHEPSTPKGQNPTKEESSSHFNEVSVPVSAAVIPLVNTETDYGVAVSEHKSDSNKPGDFLVLSDSVTDATELNNVKDSIEVVNDVEKQEKNWKGDQVSI
jgi:hypothetical protein